MFGRTMTMTADGPMEFRLYTLHHNKWSNHDVELETGSGVIPVYYDRKSMVNSVMWAIGLELALLTKNPWQVMLTTDNPNGGPFVKYPEIIGLLMSQKYREAELATVHKKTTERSSIGTIDRELSLEEITIMTRAGQAKALGLLNHGKGLLSEGAEADIAIYPMKPDQIDPSVQYDEVISAFQQTLYTLKGGTVVTRDGEVITGIPSRTFWVDVPEPAGLDISTSPRFVEKFTRFYSMELANYPVQEEYVKRGVALGGTEIVI
ncbi:MAG: formylmethanofuran dehydrogenase subunit A, partial [Methanomicrobiales archaeon HGW-Methanomicrobiales-4]